MRYGYAILSIFLLLPFALRAHSGHGSIEFVENKGQWKEPFLFKATAGGCDIYLEKNGFTFVLGDLGNDTRIAEYKHNKFKTPPVLRYHAYKMIFEGAQQPANVAGNKPQPHHYNYFLGNDPSRWKSNIHPCYNVDYKSLYPGIDLHIASESGGLKYDLIVQPGVDPDMVRLRYDGVSSLAINDGVLEVKTSVGTINDLAPYAYQYIDGRKQEVRCRYKLDGNVVSFVFPKGYDKSQPLIIDPHIVFSTFTGSSANNFGYTATYDNQGYLYAGGTAFGQGYPTNPGAYDAVFNGGGTGGGNSPGYDMAITKFSQAGNSIVWSTYIGGRDNDQPHSMVVDNGGNLFICGRTYSVNFPTQNAYDAVLNTADTVNGDITVTKMNTAGILTSSTFIGGDSDDGVNISSVWGVFNTSLKHSYADDGRSEIIADNAGNVYIAACTQSTDFPTANATQGTKGAGQDAVVFKLNSNLSNLLWSTFLGGGGDDAAYVLALDNTQANIYVSGGTTATMFTSGTAGTINPTYKGGIADGFIAKFQNSGAYTLQRATYIGTNLYDQCFGIQVDNENNVYVMGQTLGAFPVQKAAVAPSIYSNANAAQFIMKLDPNLANNIYSTTFGSSNPGLPAAVNIVPTAFLVDTCQNVYVSGWGGATAGNGGSTANMPVSLGTVTEGPPGSQPSASSILSGNTDGSDFYFFVLSKNAINLQFAGYYGGSTLAEHVDGGTSRFDKNGVIYQAVCAGCQNSDDLPTTSWAYSTTNNSTGCNLGAIKMEFNLGAVKAEAEVEPDSVVCIGTPVQFENKSTNGTAFEWDFGDGTNSTAHTPPPHVYPGAGTYNVRFIVVNPNACVVRDTAHLTITIDTIMVRPDFSVKPISTCKPFIAEFTNTSTVITPVTQFIWNFGDGKTFTGANPGTHEFPDSGTYIVTLIMIDTNACNSPDTIQKTVQFSFVDVLADFNLSDICERNDVVFPNNSVNATSYFWTFGDGDTSHSPKPIHRYDTAGVYTVWLRAYNPASCNIADSVSRTITVKPSPTADFDFTPNPPDSIEDMNKPVIFRNKSINADAYYWSFGDGTSSNETHPVHYFKRSGSFTVCLAAKNSVDCWDTVCKVSDAIVRPLVDLPTAFSPNGDGINDILYVRGGAVETLHLRIYNRWGQLIFEVKDGQANDPKYGWDGTYKELQQEMEVYAFVLDGTFTDGNTFYKKGNVTLIR